MLLLLGLPAFAFQASDDIHTGAEPNRVRRFHVERQTALRNGKSWQTYVAGDLAGWHVQFDEYTGLPWQAWGPGIEVGDLSTAADVDSALRDVWARNPGLVGVDPANLAMGRATYLADRNAWVVHYDQLLNGSPFPAEANLRGTEADFEHFVSHDRIAVWRGGVDISIQHGRVTRISVATYPQAAAQAPVVSATDAVRAATTQGPASSDAHTVDGAALVVVPETTANGLEYRTAWMIHSRTFGPLPGEWVSMVDAQTGELFNVHNQIRYLDGTISARHDTRTVDGNTSDSPLADLRVYGTSGGSNYTDATGTFSVSGDAFANLNEGRNFDVRNDAGREASYAWSSSSALWTSADATQAELDTFIFLTGVRNWALLHADDIGIVEDKMRANVNLSSTCNAYYDGTVNFFQSGGGCNNTGRIKDVIFHEWGHGMHYYAAGTEWIDGSISEGVADVVASLETNDSIMAPYFNTNGSGIRDLAPNRRYPENVVGEVHEDGLIYAGAVWDWWKLAETHMSADDAKSVVSDVIVDSMVANPSLADVFWITVAADDDDGNLDNGTPNLCDLIEAFDAHGLVPSSGDTGQALISVAHTVMANQLPTSASYAVSAELVDNTSGCFDSSVSSARVVYSTDGGDTWDETSLTVDGQVVSGAIPQAAANSIVHYYIEIDTDGGTYTAPSGGEINAFSFIVGELTEIYCNDFESDDGGFTSELLSGENTEGANDWIWGSPIGAGGDPTFAASGRKVWGNDLGGGNYNGQYQDDRHNRLTSSEIDVSGYDTVVVQFNRWLQVEDGYYDQANVLINGDIAWGNHATDRSNGQEHTLDAQWAPHTLMVPAGATSVTLAWEIISDGGLTMGGWNIDDVCVYALSTTPDDSGDPTDDGPADGDDTGGVEGDGTEDGTSGGALDYEEGGKFSAGCSSAPSKGSRGMMVIFGLALATLAGRRRKVRV